MTTMFRCQVRAASSLALGQRTDAAIHSTLARSLDMASAASLTKTGQAPMFHWERSRRLSLQIDQAALSALAATLRQDFEVLDLQAGKDANGSTRPTRYGWKAAAPNWILATAVALFSRCGSYWSAAASAPLLLLWK